MPTVDALMSKHISNAITNKQTWGGIIYNVKAYGAKGDGTTDDTSSIQSAIDTVETAGGGIVYFPPGTYYITSDLTINTSYVFLQGSGQDSLLKFSGAKLYVDAITPAEHIFGLCIKDLQLQREGTSGPVIKLYGQNTMGVARWQMNNIHITSSTGVGIEMSGAWIWDMVACVISGCSSHGMNIILAPDVNSSANAGRILGGEIQGNSGFGVYAEYVSSIGFFGTSIEGNDSGGVNLASNCRNVGFYNCYFEANGSASSDRDIIAGDVSYTGTKTTGYALKVDNCVFWDSTVNKDYAIELSRMTQVAIENSRFNSYVVGAINNNPELVNQVKGYYKNCSVDTGIISTDNTVFKKAFEEAVITHSEVYDFASIASGSSATHDFTISGANIGDFVQVSSGSNIQGLTMTAYVSGTDTVRVVLSNNTGGAVDVANSTFRFIIIPRSYFV